MLKDKSPITPIIIVHISLVEGKFMRVVSNPELLEENSDDVLREMRDQLCQIRSDSNDGALLTWVVVRLVI